MRGRPRRGAARRTVLLVLASCLLSIGCAARPAGPRPTPLLPGSPSPSPTLGIPGIPHPDPAVRAALEDDGIGSGAALLLAMTTVEGEPAGDLGYRVVQRFPTGDAATIEFTLAPQPASDPPVLRLTHEAGQERDSVALRYFVPWTALPNDGDELRASAGPSDGVLVDAAIEIGPRDDAATARYVDYLSRALGRDAATDRTLLGLQAGRSTLEALASGPEFEVLSRTIDEFQACAEQPTNPAVADAYAADPATRTAIVDGIDAVRSDVTLNAAAQALALFGTIEPALLDGSGWLGQVVGGDAAWSRATLRDRSNRRVGELEDLVPSCVGHQFELAGKGRGVHGGERIDVEWHLWGVRCTGDREWKVWESFRTSGAVEAHLDTGPPGADPLGPMLVTFGPDGAIVSSVWNEVTFPGSTIAGVALTLRPPLDPTEVVARLPAGSTKLRATQPVRALDYSIGDCD